jgi:hypothetical protein
LTELHHANRRQQQRHSNNRDKHSAYNLGARHRFVSDCFRTINDPQLITVVVSEMPQTLNDDSDAGENFEAEIDAVSTEASDGEDSSSNELETFRTILSVPQLEAPMHEVRKASTIIWLSYY